MWADRRETDLEKLLENPALATKVAKFLLATGELYQFRYLSEAIARDDNGMTEGEDGW